ncbi:hypothetical protein NKI59_34185 [Mesorhizobium sp. M0598]|uniref:hypothetical protein n=1 Tax=Mesorhizobium sp. M0598 TaxID=2956968 RepID=UPI003337D522
MIEPEQETSMVDFDAPGATAPFNIDNLPHEMLTEVFRQAANQTDRVAAFYEINALRSTNQRFRAVIESDQTIRSEFRTLQHETQSARSENAEIDARNPAGTRTANDVITYHGVTDPGAQHLIRSLAAQRDINANPGMVARTAIERNEVDDPGAQDIIRSLAALRHINIGTDTRVAMVLNDVDHPGTLDLMKQEAAQRDINAGMVAPTAIERNAVDDPDWQNIIRWAAARRDIDAGMVAPTAIERNEVNDPYAQNFMKQLAAQRDINAGMVARIALERNDVDDPRTQNSIRQQAAELEALSQQVTPNATRGLDERSRQEGGCRIR